MRTTAVSFQNRLFCRALIVLTRKVCSASGSEYPAWPSWKAGAFRKLTAVRLPALRASKKSWLSYWWFAGSGVLMCGTKLCPIAATELGRAWLGLRVIILERLVMRDIVRRHERNVRR